MRSLFLPAAALALALASRVPADPPRARPDSWMLGPFTRHPVPVLAADPEARFRCPVRDAEVRWEAKDVSHPAAVVRDRRVYLLYRAEDKEGGAAGTSRIGLAVSDDGVRFERRAAPVLHPDDDFMRGWEGEGGCEDPRVVEREDGTYVMTYTAFDGQVARLAVATSRELVRWTKHGLAFGATAGGRYENLWSKAGAIVGALDDAGRLRAARIGGQYWMYWGGPSIFAATSDNLVDWTPVERQDMLGKRLRHRGGGRYEVEVSRTRTSFQPVLAPRRGRFDSAFVEPGPPPILLPQGILLLYNGSNRRAEGDPTLPDGAYAGGQALLDPLEPTAVLARGRESFFRPWSADETSGQVPNVCFLEGLVFFRGRWLLYYGMGNSRIGVAEYRP